MNEKKDITHLGFVTATENLAGGLKFFGLCLVASTVIPTAIIVSYLNGVN